MTDRPEIFLSYDHDQDRSWRERFCALFASHLSIRTDRRAPQGDRDPNLEVDAMRRRIREHTLQASTVTVVLVGAETWRGRPVDWEIGASLWQSATLQRSGLVGILLPSYIGSGHQGYDPRTIPPRLHDNLVCDFATLQRWSESLSDVLGWIQQADRQRHHAHADSGRRYFVDDLRGDGWVD